MSVYTNTLVSSLFGFLLLESYNSMFIRGLTESYTSLATNDGRYKFTILSITNCKFLWECLFGKQKKYAVLHPQNIHNMRYFLFSLITKPCGNFCILSLSSNVQSQFLAKRRETTLTLYYILGFNKFRRKEKKYLKGEIFWFNIIFAHYTAVKSVEP